MPRKAHEPLLQLRHSRFQRDDVFPRAQLPLCDAAARACAIYTCAAKGVVVDGACADDRLTCLASIKPRMSSAVFRMFGENQRKNRGYHPRLYTAKTFALFPFPHIRI